MALLVDVWLWKELELKLILMTLMKLNQTPLKRPQPISPDIVEHGDVTKENFVKYKGKIDLVIGGSPCQGFSSAGKQLNFNDPRSKLFF